MPKFALVSSHCKKCREGQRDGRFKRSGLGISMSSVKRTNGGAPVSDLEQILGHS